MDTLTDRQQQVLNLIRRRMAEDGMPPTRAEIAEELGFKSPNAAEVHLRALARKGWIKMLPGTSRGIRLLEEVTSHGDGLPLVGRVAAGAPVLAEEHIEARYGIDLALFDPRPDYLLRVRGMSMRDAGILEGDLLAVRRTQDVRDSEIVVARLGEEVTVKRYRRQGGRVWLIPENPEMVPIEVDTTRERLEIEGVVVGVIRTGRL